MTDAPTAAPAAARPSSNGGALADHVLSSPEGGTTYYYPATADGTALGLAGFAFGLMLLSLVQVEWIPLTSLTIVVPVALGYSALGTLIGGLWGFRANNAFTALWGISFAGFWISLALILRFFAADVIAAAGQGGFLDAFGTYLLLWAIVSGYCTIAAWFVARPAFLAFLLLTIVFILLGISNIIAPDSPTVGLRKVGGYIGLIDALIAFYVSAVLLINTTSGKQLLPLWPYPYGGK